MKEKLQKHFWYYVSFICLQLAGLAGVLYFSYDKYLQITLIVLTTMFYIFWAILHHYIHHNVTPKIVVEYVLIGVLGIVVSLFMI